MQQEVFIKEATDGQLLWGRYKSILVEAESYLLELVRYIHRNPLEAGMVDRLNKYPWSSHKGYLSGAKKWDWLYKNFVLSLFSNDKADSLKGHKAFISKVRQLRKSIEKLRAQVHMSNPFTGPLS